MKVSNEPGGGHSITTEFNQREVELVYIRPVGTLQIGKDMHRMFSEKWVPDLVEALQLAEKIASRPKPWEPWDQ